VLTASAAKNREKFLVQLQSIDIRDDLTCEATTKLLVNRFVGYGIYRLNEKWRAKLREADDDGQVDINEKLKFYRSIRIFHAEAMLLDEYLKDCYDDVMLLENHGYMAMVAPAYFRFGLEVMKHLRTHITPESIKFDGSVALGNIKRELNKRIEEFSDLFERCYIERDAKCEVDCPTRFKAVEYIVEKACHSYFGCILEHVQQSTKKGGKHYVPNCFRVHLRSIVAKSGKLPPALAEMAQSSVEAEATEADEAE
jgi:hypothetical protein